MIAKQNGEPVPLRIHWAVKTAGRFGDWIFHAGWVAQCGCSTGWPVIGQRTEQACGLDSMTQPVDLDRAGRAIMMGRSGSHACDWCEQCLTYLHSMPPELRRFVESIGISTFRQSQPVTRHGSAGTAGGFAVAPVGPGWNR